MAGWYGARLVVGAFGAIMALIGLALSVVDPTIAPAGLPWLLIGLGLVLVAVIERARYRSDEASRLEPPHGPGGGEPTETTLDARFRPTDERFEDPTSRRRMRVYSDPTSGERRYVAED
jgi:hypothetical protein